ncbi:MAG: hypothetical protein OXG74_10930, partial [Acidobacteria bacterium]|nr:hypothetical protein [Acidobacteriota bacterium]
MDDLKQARALPFWGEGDTPPESPSKAPEEQGFVAVLRIFVRTWPYLWPQIVGRWRELPRNKAAAGDAAADGAWSFRHVPPLVTVLTALGPLLWLAPPGTDWRHDLLLAGTVLMTVLVWTLLFVRGRAYLWASFALVLSGTAAFLFALFGVEGLADTLYVGLVAAACVCIWVLQYRVDGGRLSFRVRLGSHLVYYFVLVWASTLLTMVIALFSVDLISQSILQAEPLTPFLADFIGRSELAGETQPGAGAESGESEAAQPNIDLAPLTAEQRHSLKWIYAVFMVFGWFAQLPVMMLLPYYYIFIMQRVNQDLRMAL